MNTHQQEEEIITTTKDQLVMIFPWYAEWRAQKEKGLHVTGRLAPDQVDINGWLGPLNTTHLPTPVRDSHTVRYYAIPGKEFDSYPGLSDLVRAVGPSHLLKQPRPVLPFSVAAGFLEGAERVWDLNSFIISALQNSGSGSRGLVGRVLEKLTPWIENEDALESRDQFVFTFGAATAGGRFGKMVAMLEGFKNTRLSAHPGYEF